MKKETRVTSSDIKLSHLECINDLMLYKKNSYPKKAPFLSQCHGAMMALRLLANMPFMERWQGRSPNDFFQHQVCLDQIKTHNYAAPFISLGQSHLYLMMLGTFVHRTWAQFQITLSLPFHSAVLIQAVHCNGLLNDLLNDERVSQCKTG